MAEYSFTYSQAYTNPKELNLTFTEALLEVKSDKYVLILKVAKETALLY